MYIVHATRMMHSRLPGDSFVEEGYGEKLLHDVSNKGTTEKGSRHPEDRRRGKGIAKGERVERGPLCTGKRVLECKLIRIPSYLIWLLLNFNFKFSFLSLRHYTNQFLKLRCNNFKYFFLLCNTIVNYACRIHNLNHL